MDDSGDEDGLDASSDWDSSDKLNDLVCEFELAFDGLDKLDDSDDPDDLDASEDRDGPDELDDSIGKFELPFDFPDKLDNSIGENEPESDGPYKLNSSISEDESEFDGSDKLDAWDGEDEEEWDEDSACGGAIFVGEDEVELDSGSASGGVMGGDFDPCFLREDLKSIANRGKASGMPNNGFSRERVVSDVVEEVPELFPYSTDRGDISFLNCLSAGDSSSGSLRFRDTTCPPDGLFLLQRGRFLNWFCIWTGTFMPMIALIDKLKKFGEERNSDSL